MPSDRYDHAFAIYVRQHEADLAIEYLTGVQWASKRTRSLTVTYLSAEVILGLGYANLLEPEPVPDTGDGATTSRQGTLGSAQQVRHSVSGAGPGGPLDFGDYEGSRYYSAQQSGAAGPGNSAAAQPPQHSSMQRYSGPLGYGPSVYQSQGDALYAAASFAAESPLDSWPGRALPQPGFSAADAYRAAHGVVHAPGGNRPPARVFHRAIHRMQTASGPSLQPGEHAGGWQSQLAYDQGQPVYYREAPSHFAGKDLPCTHQR